MLAATDSIDDDYVCLARSVICVAKGQRVGGTLRKSSSCRPMNSKVEEIVMIES